MWTTMGCYSDGSDFNGFSDPFNSGRKLRTLIPRPLPSPSRQGHGHDFFPQHHHLATVADQSKKLEFNNPPVVVSSRWNPTPDQLRALEELYRRGTRTPSAEQIQNITSQLRRYGKIEGKNVFYWFQNHKARERQKRRRQMDSAHDDPPRDIDILERKDSGAGRTEYEQVEQTKNWAPSKNCSTLTEESVSRTGAKAGAVTECRTDGWIQFHEEELQRRKNFAERNATWQMMQLSCPTSLINTPSSRTTSATLTTMGPNHHLIMTHHHDHDHYHDHHHHDHFNINGENGCADFQTLELFPLHSDTNTDEETRGKEMHTSFSVINNIADITQTSQFFEFLPLKN